MTIATDAVHAGEPDPRISGSVVMPIFQSAMFVHAGTNDYAATKYIRLSNTPNHDALAKRIATLEGAEAAIVSASGMAAISTAMLAVLRAGDHVVVLDGLYGGTRMFAEHLLPRFGIEATFADPLDASTWSAACRDDTRAIYTDSIGNPMMQVPDLRALVELARARELVSIIDNTMTSPACFRPCTIGFDLSVHSATKYLNGHSDLVAGAVAGRADLVAEIAEISSHLGGSLDPHACFLLERGIKTMPLRVERQCATALALAERLAAHPAVRAVHYPGLPSTAGHEHARALFDGYGGTLAFEVDGDADAMIDRLSIPVHAVSLGGVETLVIRPAATAYANVPPETRRELGISDDLIRVSVGIEDADDLIRDFERGLDQSAR